MLVNIKKQIYVNNLEYNSPSLSKNVSFQQVLSINPRNNFSTKVISVKINHFSSSCVTEAFGTIILLKISNTIKYLAKLNYECIASVLLI